MAILSFCYNQDCIFNDNGNCDACHIIISSSGICETYLSEDDEEDF